MPAGSASGAIDSGPACGGVGAPGSSGAVGGPGRCHCWAVRPQLFTSGLAKLVLEVLGLLGLAVLIGALRSGRRPALGEFRVSVVIVVAVVMVALVCGLAIEQFASAGSTLNTARRSAVSAREGVERCFFEQGAGSRLAFIRWVKRQIGPHAVYAFDYAGEPDVLCVYLVMLPALPATPGERADWTVAFGVIPPAMRARIARHDPAVRVFAPGFALESERGR